MLWLYSVHAANLNGHIESVYSATRQWVQQAIHRKPRHALTCDCEKTKSIMISIRNSSLRYSMGVALLRRWEQHVCLQTRSDTFQELKTFPPSFLQRTIWKHMDSHNNSICSWRYISLGPKSDSSQGMDGSSQWVLNEGMFSIPLLLFFFVFSVFYLLVNRGSMLERHTPFVCLPGKSTECGISTKGR